MDDNIDIGNYILKRKITKGEVSDGFLSINKKNNELLYIKRMSKGKMNSEQKKKLQEEINILNKLKSKNIISFKSFTKSSNHYYLIFEYCNGGDLSKYINDYMKENKKPLNDFYIQKIIKQVILAIEYMHLRNIIHRNIKLENILLNFDNYFSLAENGNLPPQLTFNDKSLNKKFTVKLVGLNCCKVLKNQSETSTIIGNPNSAPDILNAGKGNKGYDKSVDLWSLGVITYELLTGSPPFKGKTSEEIFNSIQEGTYTLPNNLKCSTEIISFINGLLQYSPEKRLNWEQIKSHPFLNKNPGDFEYIELVKISENEQIKLNSKDSDNSLWRLFKCENLNLNLDNINQKEIEKPDVKAMLKKTVILNNDIKKASEEEEIEKKKEMERIENMRAKAEEEIKKAELEKNNKQKKQKELIKDEEDIKNMKKKLKEKIDKEESEDSDENIAKIDLKLEKNKSDKEILEKEIDNNETIIKENKKRLEIIEEYKSAQKKMEDENERLKKELEKLKEDFEKKKNIETSKETNDITESIDSEMFGSCIIVDKNSSNITEDDFDCDFDFDYEDNTDDGWYEKVDNNYLKEKFDKI